MADDTVDQLPFDREEHDRDERLDEAMAGFIERMFLRGEGRTGGGMRYWVRWQFVGPDGPAGNFGENYGDRENALYAAKKLLAAGTAEDPIYIDHMRQSGEDWVTVETEEVRKEARQ
jgi:hypothetical protein